MTCSACDRARDQQNAAGDTLADVTARRAVAVRAEINGERQAIFFRQNAETEQYHTVQQVESEPISEEKTCDRSTALSIVSALTGADALDVEYGPIEDIWPGVAGGDGQ